MLVGFGVLVCASMTPYSSDGHNYDVKIYIEKGWNLILTPDLDMRESNFMSDSDIQKDDIRAVYLYVSEHNKYYETYPNNDKLMNVIDSLSQDSQNFLNIGSVWVYSDKSGYLKYQRVDVPKYSQVKLLSGWNFVSITPECIDKSFEELKGNCNIKKMYWWSIREQYFLNILSDKERMEVLRFSENAGNGLLIKVPKSCTLFTNTSGNFDIPNIPNIKECTDSDGGAVIDIKGQTGNFDTGDFYNDVCFIKESATETTSVAECSGSSCYLKEYYCDSQTGNSVSFNVLCKERGFSSCQNGACV